MGVVGRRVNTDIQQLQIMVAHGSHQSAVHFLQRRRLDLSGSNAFLIGHNHSRIAALANHPQGVQKFWQYFEIRRLFDIARRRYLVDDAVAIKKHTRFKWIHTPMLHGGVTFSKVWKKWAQDGWQGILEEGEELCCKVYTCVYSAGTMQHKTSTPAGLLHQIANLQRMEPGKLCVIGQGKDGPYYNLQCREQGQPVSRYIPQDQVETVAHHTANYRTFQSLVDQYAQVVITQTRAERMGGQKKSRRPASTSRTKNARS